jgi:hypothetical protein
MCGTATVTSVRSAKTRSYAERIASAPCWSLSDAVGGEEGRDARRVAGFRRRSELVHHGARFGA